jgi:hypothetical protein
MRRSFAKTKHCKRFRRHAGDSRSVDLGRVMLHGNDDEFANWNITMFNR